MVKKYRLTDEYIMIRDVKLFRIEAVKDFKNVKFKNVKKGDKGGFVENENNLSHDGDCWIYGEAKVFGNAKVYGSAIVCGYAEVYGNADIFDNAEVYGNAMVHGGANVFGSANVFGNAEVYGCANVYDNAIVNGYAEVYGYAKIYNNANVFDNARVFGISQVCGDAEVCGEAKVCRNALIESISDYIVFKNWWSSGIYFTWTRSNNMWRVGCFYGTGEELIEKAYKDSELSGREYERVVKYVESIINEDKYEKEN